MLAFPKDGWHAGIGRIIGGLFQYTLQHARLSCPLSGIQTEDHVIRDDAEIAVPEIVFRVSTKETTGHLDYWGGRLVAGTRGDLWPGKGGTQGEGAGLFNRRQYVRSTEPGAGPESNACIVVIAPVNPDMEHNVSVQYCHQLLLHLTPPGSSLYPRNELKVALMVRLYKLRRWFLFIGIHKLGKCLDLPSSP